MEEKRLFSALRVLWLIVAMGAVAPAEETRLQGVTVVVLTTRLTAAKSLS